MDARSFQETLEQALLDARDEHNVQVITSQSNKADWPSFYAKFITRKLTPLLTALQEHETVCKRGTGITFTVDGEAIAPFYTRATQEEVGSTITSRFHTGE